MSDFGSYPWYVGDWRSSELVAEMSAAERGIYRELLDYCWEQGSLPTSEAILRKWAGVDEHEWAQCWPRVSRGFTERDGRLWNFKVEEKRPDVLRSKENRRAAGRVRATTAARSGGRFAPADHQHVTSGAGESAPAQHQQITSTPTSTAPADHQPSPSPSPSPSPTTCITRARTPLPLSFDPQSHFDRLWATHPAPARYQATLQEYLAIVGEHSEPEPLAERIQRSCEAYRAYWLASGRSPTGMCNWLRDGDWAREPPPVPQPIARSRTQQLLDAI